MARINIEDKLFSDGRWMKLVIKCGCRHKAIGILTGAWILAQKNWLQYGFIPKKAWDTDFDILIDVELATRRADGNVYVKGSKKAFRWLDQRSDAGSLGGSASTDKKKKAAQKNGEKGGRPKTQRSEQADFFEHDESDLKSNVVEENPSGAKRNPSGEQRGQASSSYSSSSSSSYSLSSSDSKKNKVPTEPTKKGQLFIAAYCQAFKQKYGFNPEITPQDSGNAKKWVQDMTPERITIMVQAYFAMPDAWLVKTKHPIPAFKTKLNEIAVFANSGKFTTNTQANQADAFASNAMLLDQVRRGEL